MATSRLASALVLGHPLRLSSIVCAGFGRGSAQLGWPTASILPTTDVRDDLATLDEVGTYCGWAVCHTSARGESEGDNGRLFEAVINVGVDPNYVGKYLSGNRFVDA